MLGVFHDESPAGIFAEIENVFRVVKNGLIDKSALSVRNEFLPALFKTVVGILKEDKAEYNVLVLGRLDGAAQFVCGFPERFFDAFCLNLLFCHSGSD